jgi:hypothetical protein
MCDRHGIKKDAPESNEAELLKLAKNVVTSIQSAVASLQKLTPKSNGEKLAYMADILPQQIEQARRNRTINAINTARFGLETNLRENDLSVRLAIEGNDKVRDDLIGKSRDLFRQTRYMRFEECSTEHIRLQRLWSELHSHHYESIKPGLNKASFLTESYPIKSCYRDQLICKSLELPDLNYLDDMGRISEEIANEESIDILLLLRDTLHSQELAQVAEVRLYELFNRAPTEFLKHPLIVARMADTLKSLPEVLQQLFASNERLLGVGMCFAYASREKDRHLLQFKDSANDRQIKEAFGALLSDPNLASTEGTVLFKKRQDADSLFASMAALAPYDKAQALLYFMGTRGFYSPLYEWFEGYSDEDKDDTASAYGRDRDEVGWVGSTITPLIRQEGSGSFPEPDVLIRAQKAFGMAITTAENLKAGLLKLDLQMN